MSLFAITYKSWNFDFSALRSHSMLSVGEDAEHAIELAKLEVDSDCREFEATKIKAVFGYPIQVNEKS